MQDQEAFIKEEGQKAMKDTEEFFGFRVALSTEGKIGKTARIKVIGYRWNYLIGTIV